MAEMFHSFYVTIVIIQLYGNTHSDPLKQGQINVEIV